MTSSRIIAPFLAAIAVVALCGAASAEATPGLDERYVSDPASGVALYGYDPVAYFTVGRAVLGKREYETEWGGAAWRFSSDANRAAFLSAPEVYAPQFGGYDPKAIASGAAAPGHPLVFAVIGDRLYLFRTAADRDAFSDPGAAKAAWPQVEAGLVR